MMLPASLVTLAATARIAVMSNGTVLAALSKSVLDAAASLGADVPAIVEEAGFDPAVLEDPDGRVPIEQHLKMWAILSRRGDGIAIGARLGTASMGVVGYAIEHGATVRDALAFQQRMGAVIHRDVVPKLEQRGDRIVFSRPIAPPFAQLREPVYAQAAATVATMQALTGRDVRAAFVTFPLPRPADPSAIERHFACPIGWGATLFEIAFEAALLDVPLPRSDPRLFGYLARRAEELLAQLPSDATWSDRARREIGALLADGEPRLAQVAQRLGVSERTLHRRLDEEGTGFATLVDEARRARALLLLDDRSLSASEIAFLLGYTEPAAFFRAFKRWTGETPQTWRRGRA